MHETEEDNEMDWIDLLCKCMFIGGIGIIPWVQRPGESISWLADLLASRWVVGPAPALSVELFLHSSAHLC